MHLRYALGLVPLLILATQSVAVAQDAGTAASGEDICQSAREAQQRQCAVRLAAGIRIARARADAPMMEQQATELNDLLDKVRKQEASQGNQGLVDRVCDVDCTIERASAQLFRATTYPILSTKPMSPNTDDTLEAPLLGVIMDGLGIVEHGLLTLPRRKGSYGGQASSAEASFQRYLEGLAALSALKVRLLMAGGDLWYRTASANTIRSVAYAVGEAAGTAGSTPGEIELEKARAFYEEAFWSVVEAQTGVPAKESYSALFLDLRNLQGDLSQRLDSVHKGMLFLQVDPDQQAQWTLPKIGSQLQAQAAALDTLDTDVTARLKEWSERKVDYAQNNLDYERYANSKSVEAEVYRLAEIQNVAELRSREFERELADLETGLAKIDDQLHIEQIVASLQRDRLELSNELRMIELETTEDLLALNKESIQGELESVGARIEKTLADYNFEMQMQELEQRKINLSADRRSYELEIAQVAARQEQLVKRKEIENTRIGIANTNIAQLTATQGAVFAQQKAAMQTEMDGIDDEIAFLGRSGANLDAVCAQRARNADLEGEAWAAVETCMKSGCDGHPGLQPAYEALYEANGKVLENEADGLKSLVAGLNDSIARTAAAISAYRKGVGTLATAQEALADAQKWSAGSSALSGALGGLGNSVPLGGMGGGASGGAGAGASGGASAGAWAAVAILVAGVASQIFDFACNVDTISKELEVRAAERELGSLQFDFEANNANDELFRAITQAESELKGIDFDKLVDQATRDRMLAELGVQLKQTEAQVVVVKAEKSLGAMECQGDKLDLERTKARLVASKQTLVAQLAAKQSENSLIAYDIEQQRELQEQSRLEIERIGAESRELALEGEQTQARLAATAALEQAVAEQQGQVTRYRSNVNTLTEQQQSLEATKRDLSERVKDHRIAIADERRAFVTAALESAEKAAAQQLALLAQKIEKYSEQTKVRDAMAALQKALSEVISKSNDKILDLIGQDAIQAQAGRAEMAAMFWDFEGMLSKMTRGIPEVIERKRGLIENVNFWYNLYRNRYRLLSSFSSDVAADDHAPVFLTTADDIRKELGRACIEPGLNEICRPNSLALSNSTISGKRALFTLDRFDSVLLELADDGMARLEISPYASPTLEEPSAGGRVLWKNNMNRDRPLLLLDAAIYADGCVDAAASHSITLTHLGFGTQVRPAGGAAFVEFVAPGAAAKQELILHPDTDLGSSAQTFDGKSVPLSEVEALFEQVHDAGFPLFGYPVVGLYELGVDSALRACLLRNRPRLTLKIVFAN